MTLGASRTAAASLTIEPSGGPLQSTLSRPSRQAEQSALPSAGAGAMDFAEVAVHAPGEHHSASAASRFPHFDRLQQAFGRHALSDVEFQTGSDARARSQRLGASGFTIGESITLAEPSDLRTAAHEAAHVIQQRGGTLDGSGGHDEQRADAVADAVVAGRSAEPLLNDPPAGARPTAALQLKRVALSWSQVDVTFNAWLRELGDVDKALARTKAQIGGPMPPDYVPPPRRPEAQREARRQQQLQAIRDLYVEYVSDENFQLEFFGDVILHPIDAARASDKELAALARNEGFQKWMGRRAAKAQRERIEQENLVYQSAIGGPESGYTPQEAREIIEGQGARSDLGVPMFDKETGMLVGYVKQVFAQKSLAGAVGTVTPEYYDLNGKFVKRGDPKTVLTPAAEFFQDVARNAPVVGYVINVAEIGLGESLNLRDKGRNLSPAEAIDRAISAFPGADLARTATEVGTGVSLSGREDLERYWEGEARLLSKRERTGKAIVLGTAAVTTAIGYAQSKLGPKIGPKRDWLGREKWLEDFETPASVKTSPSAAPSHKEATAPVHEPSGGEAPRSAIFAEEAPAELPKSRYVTPARQRVAVTLMEEANEPRSLSAAAKEPPPPLPARRASSKAALAGEGAGERVPSLVEQRRKDILGESAAVKERVLGEQKALDAERAKVADQYRETQRRISRLESGAERGDPSALRALREQLDDLHAEHTNLTNRIEELGGEWHEAHRWAQTGDDAYFKSLSDSARQHPSWQTARSRTGGLDEVFGGDPSKLAVPDALEMDHIVPQSRIRNMPGFEKLSPNEQIALLARDDNLVGMRKAANIDRGTQRYGQWKGWKKFVADPAAEAQVARTIANLAKREADLEVAIQKQIDSLLAGRPR